MNIDLPDLNVWLALTWPLHPQHLRARHYWQAEAGERVVFCTATALGLVRLLCRESVMGEAVLTPVAAGEVLERLCSQTGVGFGGEPSDGWDVFHALLRKGTVPSQHCTDAHLAALAIVNGWRLVSFDAEFEPFAGLKWLRL
ncbi:MAG: TA system VapC family ribonuclease toxin [Cyanobacteriota bacterium]|jgi:toxin-antitoxin system PIN domain toxin|nr:TA system VapC family ribonuclease toxin [Cyanobacteriota bacterium]